MLRAHPLHWGCFGASLAPVLTVRSGDLIGVEAISHYAGDDPDLMLDAGIEALFDGVPPERRRPGPDIMTGPIYIENTRSDRLAFGGAELSAGIFCRRRHLLALSTTTSLRATPAAMDVDPLN